MTHLAIGDFLYQGVWLNALKAKYPHLTIDIWFDDCRRKPHSWAAGRNKTLGEWLAAEGSFETVYPIVSNLSERKAQIKAAGNKDYDLIVFIGKNRSEQFAKIARQISSSAFIVAAKSKPLTGFFAKWWHFHQLDGQFSFDQYASNDEHITRTYAKCFEKVFGLTAEDIQGQTILKIRYAPEHREWAQEFIRSFDHGEEGKVLVFVNHLATSRKKDYPWDQLRKVLLTLNGGYKNLAFIVNTAPDKFEEITGLVERDEQLAALRIKVFTAIDNFFQLPALMAECDIVITVDTATSHLAASLGKPQVTIMANDEKLWQPLGDSLILEGSGQVSSITPAQIVEAFGRLYSEYAQA